MNGSESKKKIVLARRGFLSAVSGGALAFTIPGVLGGCGGEESEEGSGGGGGGAASGESKSFLLSVGDTIGYDKSEMRVGAGDEVTVSIQHTGSMGVESMGHNFVLLKKDVDMTSFATAAIQAADNGYIPADRADEIIAHTSLIGGGEQDSVTFQAPSPATYKYLCTFPGHYSSMNGDFIVS